MTEELEYKLENCYLCNAKAVLKTRTNVGSTKVFIGIVCSGCGKTELWANANNIDFLVKKWNLYMTDKQVPRILKGEE